MRDDAIRFGVVGLGRAFTLMLPTFVQDQRVRLVAAVDPRAEACARFVHEFGGAAYQSIEALCRDPGVELVYIASPHQCHADHVRIAIEAGKAVLVEKPMAISLEACTEIVEAVEQQAARVVVGHSHSFDGPVLHAAKLLSSGSLGNRRMLHAMNYTDYLYRPRRPEELDTQLGGGVMFSQAAHQVDVVRLLMGGLVSRVKAYTGRWDPSRPTEGAYMALLSFTDGAFASLTYSGYAHYDTDELMDYVSEMGFNKSTQAYSDARVRLVTTNSVSEARLKAERNYGGAAYVPEAMSVAPHHQHFGSCVISADKADVRLTPSGIMVYADRERRFEPTPQNRVPRQEVIDELWAVIREGMTPLHSVQWARANIEVCLAMLESAKSGKEIDLKYQIAPSGL